MVRARPARGVGTRPGQPRRRRSRKPREAPGDQRPVTTGGAHGETAAERADAVLHVLEAGAVDLLGVESGAVVLDVEPDLVAVLAQRHGDVHVRAAVLGGVLDRLETAVV